MFRLRKLASTSRKLNAFASTVLCLPSHYLCPEQRLEAGEEVDLPVLFLVEPEFLDDAHMRDVNVLTLSYTFFPSYSDDNDEEDLD